MNATPCRKILLVDDEETILKSVGIDLRQEGFDVTLAHNGNEAIYLCKAQHFDLVITDLAMPGITGLEVVQRVKEREPETAVLILTGYADLSTAIEALRLGADDYLQKPCDFEELQLRISRCFEKQALLTKVKIQNKKLAESNNMKTLLLESASEGIYGLDLHGITTFINSAGEKMLGYTTTEIVGKNSHEIIHHTRGDGSPYPKVECQMLRVIREDRIIKVTDEVLWRKDGSSFPVEYTSAPIKKNGMTTGVVVVFSDITERKVLEDEKRLKEAYLWQMEKHQSLNCMAGGIAHNFNNILTAVLGNLELALRVMPENSAAKEFISSSYNASKLAAKLSTKMLQFVGQSAVVKKDIDLTAIAGEIGKSFAGEVGDDISLTLSLDNDLFLHGDIDLIRQVILNLLTNAVEAIADNIGAISMQTGKKYFSTGELNSPHITKDLSPGEYVFVEIRDTGRGIKKDVLNRVFEPFFSEKFTGRGMGLATVLGIMRIHLGAITLTSVPGKGTTARAIFPAIAPPIIAAKVENEPSPLQDDRRVVLLADDTPEMLEIGEEFLKWSGYTTISAVDGFEAIERFKANKKKIIMAILDVSMPHMDGIEVCQAIRATSDIPILMITAYSIDEIAGNLQEYINIDFLQKPFTGKSFEEKIKEMLHHD